MSTIRRPYFPLKTASRSSRTCPRRWAAQERPYRSRTRPPVYEDFLGPRRNLLPRKWRHPPSAVTPGKPPVELVLRNRIVQRRKSVAFWSGWARLLALHTADQFLAFSFNKSGSSMDTLATVD